MARHNRAMPNVAAALKNEISRIARKATRAETAPMLKALRTHRAQISALKRSIAQLERKVNALSRSSARAAPIVKNEKENEGESAATRFSAKGLSANRQRLGLSARTYGALVGASALSIYNWEQGKVRPRAKHIAALAALRTIGKKEADARLQMLLA